MKKSVILFFSILLVSVCAGVYLYGQTGGATKALTANAAQVDYFLKIEGIDGESIDDQHPGTIEIDSFSWGVSNSSSLSGGGGGSGKVSVHDISFTSKVSKASPNLMLATATGKHYPRAILFVRKAGGTQQDYYKVTLQDIMVTSYQSSAGGSGGDVPTDQFSLNFTKIEFEYKTQKEDGTLGESVKASYDLKKATK